MSEGWFVDSLQAHKKEVCHTPHMTLAKAFLSFIN